MKAVVAAFNQEKALVGAFSVMTNLRMELFEALVDRPGPANLVAACAGLLGTAAVDTWHGELARVAARGGPGSWSHSLARHAFSMLWGWADITLWKGEPEHDPCRHVGGV